MQDGKGKKHIILKAVVINKETLIIFNNIIYKM
jgi:hypothetical protein